LDAAPVVVGWLKERIALSPFEAPIIAYVKAAVRAYSQTIRASFQGRQKFTDSVWTPPLKTLPRYLHKYDRAVGFGYGAFGEP
jgi:hypothetical protein